ncbi:hypothetical protein LV28_18315 [Pandoraea pnomenusa]|nr:hypothetical protein LV28_18315 [Pandoraea pnomenusa]
MSAADSDQWQAQPPPQAAGALDDSPPEDDDALLSPDAAAGDDEADEADEAAEADDGAPEAGALAPPDPPRKSVTYHPEPLSWNPAAVTCLRNESLPHSGHWVSGASLIFCSTSLAKPHVSQR